VRLKLDPIQREVSLLFPFDLSDAGKSQTLAEFAQRQIEEVDTANYRVVGHRIPYDVWVDGREGAALASVKPMGRIEAEWTFYEDLLLWIDQQLIAHSPVGRPPKDAHPGLYMQSHELTADGRLVDRAQPMPMAEEYVFVNTQPYARKIEGTGNRAPQSLQAPYGVYEVVATLAARRFGNLARIRYGFRSPLFGSLMEWAGRTRLQPKGRRRTGSSRQDWLTRQPAVIVTPR
jgi:hypothetical protein